MNGINRKNTGIMLMSVLFFMAILALYSRVFYYHDDFGYASWSYCLDAPLNSLWDFLKFHFFNVNGRITGTIFLATLPRLGLWIPRIAMSICVFVIFAYLFLFSACSNNIKIENYILIFACIGLFSLELYSGCFFWYSAAFMYLIPTMFFLPCVHIQNKKSLQNTDIVLFYIFSTLAALGQEVITVGILGYSICFAIYTKFYEKQGLRPIDIFLIIIASLSFFLMLSSPGNRARIESDANVSFYSLSLFTRIKTSIPYIARKIFNEGIRIFDIYFELCAILCCILNIVDKTVKKRSLLFNCLFLLSSLLMITGEIFCPNGYYEFIHTNIPVYNIVILIQLFFLLIPIVIHLWTGKSKTLILFLCAGLSSLLSLLAAPTDTHPRAIILFFFAIISILVCVTGRIIRLGNPRLKWLYILAFCILPTFNIAKTYIGYNKNYEVNRTNDITLKETSKNPATSSIILTKLPDKRYADYQPYDCPYIFTWMKIYYGIDKNVDIIYQNPDKNTRL